MNHDTVLRLTDYNNGVQGLERSLNFLFKNS